jgi:hypothetical protein
MRKRACFIRFFFAYSIIKMLKSYLSALNSSNFTGNSAN